MYRPFNKEEMIDLVGRLVVFKRRPYMSCLIPNLEDDEVCDSRLIYVGGHGLQTAQDLLDNFTFLDGTCCGVEIK